MFQTKESRRSHRRISHRQEDFLDLRFSGHFWDYSGLRMFPSGLSPGMSAMAMYADRAGIWGKSIT